MNISPILKNKRGAIIHSGERKIIHNVFNYYKQCDLKTTADCVQITASACGVSERTVFRILSEQKRTNTLKTPGQKRARLSLIDKFNEQDKCALRRKVHSIFLNKDYPTLNKIMTLCEADEDIPKFKRTSLHKMLHELGFDFNKQDNRTLLIERDDIVLWRRKYLRQIKEHRKAHKSIYFIGGLSTGPIIPVGKGERLIVLHIGSNKGFVEGGLLVFESKSTKDYHEEMDGDRFFEWFNNIMPKLDPGSIVIMDNTPYHCIKLENLPSTTWNKQEIIDWLQSKGISVDTSYLKKELLMKVTTISPQYDKYLIDETAKTKGIEILRLPPYHYNLNAIEMVWAQMKNYIAANNSTFKMTDVKKLFYDSIQLIDTDQWKKSCDYVINEENVMWDLDEVMEVAEENFLINVNEDSINSD